MGLLSPLLKLLRPSERTRGPAEEFGDHHVDARIDLVDGKAMTPDGGLIDFESDSEQPRY